MNKYPYYVAVPTNPHEVFTEALADALWDRAVTIARANTTVTIDINTFDVYEQLQRDAVAHIMDGLGELGESPAMKNEREECAYSRPAPVVDNSKPLPFCATEAGWAQHQAEQVEDALDRALWNKAGAVAHEKQLDSVQRRNLHRYLRARIETGIKAFDAVIHELGESREFCIHCGAGKGKHRRDGEGTCEYCD